MKKMSFIKFLLILTNFLIFGCGSNDGKKEELADSSGIDKIEDSHDISETSDIYSEIDISNKSFYTMNIKMKDGKEYKFDKDLTGKENIVFSFGLTHIAPAISFAMTDTIYDPTYVIITINFGIIYGTTEHPTQTPEAGDYKFAGYPPDIQVFIKDIQYCSKVKGSEGIIHITDWGLYTGDLFAGSFEGKILQNKEGSCEKVDKSTGEKLYLDINGTYHFILPELNDGQ